MAIFESRSIFSSFSSSKFFRSLTSASRVRTRSSSDSVYPRGKALRLNLSLVLHSKPTFAHCEQHGRIPSHRIFLLLHLSHACAIRLCELEPTLITFIGRMPGMMGDWVDGVSVVCCRDPGGCVLWVVKVRVRVSRSLYCRQFSIYGTGFLSICSNLNRPPSMWCRP